MTQTQSTPWAAPFADHPLDATVMVPGSKSLSNRYLLLAALGNRPVHIEGLLHSRDTELMMNALRTLGVTIEDHGHTVVVTPPATGHFTGDTHIQCGLAGTVMRFVPALVLYANGPVDFDGDAQAYARPMQPLLDGLEQLGCTVAYHGIHGFLPFTVTPPQTLPTDHRMVAIDSSQSSQFVSGLLLAASRLPAGMTLRHTGNSLPSMPHIRMTVADVALAGGHIRMPGSGTWVVEPAQLNLPVEIVVEPDLSNAAPFLGAALIAGGAVRVPHWPISTTQPGGMLPEILERMGATVLFDDLPWRDRDQAGRTSAVLTVCSDGTIAALGSCDLSAVGEITPSIAALCMFANGDSQLHGIGHLRGHETDRLHALTTEIARIGGMAHELDDGIAIDAVPRSRLHGAVMATYADHRMATFAAMVGLAVHGIRIEHVETVRKTLPDFTELWTAMTNTSHVNA